MTCATPVRPDYSPEPAARRAVRNAGAGMPPRFAVSRLMSTHPSGASPRMEAARDGSAGHRDLRRGQGGTALARLLVASGHGVLIAGSPRQTALDLLVGVVAPGAEVTSPEILAEADVIIVAVPFGKAGTVPWARSTAASSSTP